MIDEILTLNARLSQLPIGESSHFIKMFEELEKLIKDHQIESYGVGVTTLDEVFLLVARGEEGLHLSERKDEALDIIEEDNPTRQRSFLDTASQQDTGREQFKRHVQALFAKRALNFKRDKKAWCCSIILPTLTSLFGFLIVNLISRQNPNYPSLSLSLDQNNPEITVERNPLPFNNKGVYDCQPGECIYGSRSTTNLTLETSELYYFCGANAQVDDDDANGTTTCTIDDSISIIKQIDQYGAFGVQSDVSDVFNVSSVLYIAIMCVLFHFSTQCCSIYFSDFH